MNHDEAVTLMAVERYLLNDLPHEIRDSFEEHMFDCAECALDLRSGAAFVDGARKHLPQLVEAIRPIDRPGSAAHKVLPQRKKSWFLNLQTAWAVPAFAALLLLVGYQNIATIPHLRASATSPRLMPWSAIHAGTRGGEAVPVRMSHRDGGVVLIDLPQDSSYTSYAFALLSPDGKALWSQSEAAPAPSAQGAAGTLSLVIPGARLPQGSYTLTITGMNSQGERTPIDRRALDLQFAD